MNKIVKKIPATIIIDRPKINIAKRKVAGYARVSTDYAEQITSYQAQLKYYTDYIKSRNDWIFVDVYTDEGISGTNTKNREGFNRMIKDALDGKIDLIITKSVSRFARNTVDSLTTVRKLKEKGVEIFFEKENIWTFDSKGELLITIMSSLAQEESRSISENTTWGHRRRFAEGKVSFAHTRFLGYDLTKEGKVIVNEEEAKVIRRIYREYLEGNSTSKIAQGLTKDGILTPGKREVWHTSTLHNILRNEKYKGDVLLQKEYTVDFLTKKKAKNNGEVPQYYIENNHEAIIDPFIWDLVQSKLKRHNNKYHIFTGNIKCAECGENFISRTWHSNSKYKKKVWQCKNKVKGKCPVKHVTEDQVKEAFM